MAITNKTIIENQVKRINEMAGTEVVAKRAHGYWWVCIEGTNGVLLPPDPFSKVLTGRTPGQMIEYLAGIEDAVAHYTGNK